MNLIGTLAIAMGAGWVSGVNLYAAVATLGLLGRLANLRLPGELDARAPNRLFHFCLLISSPFPLRPV